MNIGAGLALLAVSLSGEQGNADQSTNATDYAVPSHWLSVPVVTNKAVDLFYLYPTAWTSTNPNPEVCAIDEPSMLQQAPQSFARQATAFDPVANIFAPFYRQANLTPVSPSVVAGIPTTDGMAAFEYYIDNFNKGRPFIMAGHSQGANVLNNMLAQYMKSHPEVQARMIAAYVIGYPVTADYLSNNPNLKFAEGANDAGAIISYNTQYPTVPPGANPILWGLTGIVINPILWTRDTTLATTNQGFGSYMPNSNGVYERIPQYADARIDPTQGVLICTTADTNALGKLTPLAAVGVFHSFDYPFYYFNIRSNAADRTQAFLNRYYFTSSGVCADYDGDAKADPAVYDEASGIWKIRLSSAGYYMITTTLNSLGGPGYASVSADYDGDAKADPAVYQEAVASGQAGTWKIMLSSANYTLVTLANFLGGLGFSAMAADYDGDRKVDPCVYERDHSTGSGTWKIKLSSANYTPITSANYLGGNGCRPVAADYDGDGKADPAVYDETSGLWTINLSSAGYVSIAFPDSLGGSGYIPVPADYDGDGKADPAVMSQIPAPSGAGCAKAGSTNEWIIMFSTANYAPVHLALVFE